MVETRETCLAQSSIPGYSGYQPGFALAPVPIKIAGRLGFHAPPQPPMQPPPTLPPPRPVSEYRTAFPLHSVQRRPASSPLTTLNNTASTGLRPPELSGGVSASPASTVGHATARAAACAATRRALSADDGGGASINSGSSNNSALWYRTTYGSTNAPVAAAAASQARQSSAGRSAAAAQSAATTTAPPVLTQSSQQSQQQQQQHRHQQRGAISSISARFDGATTYLRDYFARPAAGGGATGATRAWHADTQTSAAPPPPPRYGCNAATTAELGAGTSRACAHVPGYTGFVPASPAAPAAARAQGARAAPHGDRKAGALLSALGQFSRGRTPGYTGHKPRAAANGPASPPPPTGATTRGFYDQQLFACSGARAALAGAPRHGINSRAGLLSFFTQGVQGGRAGDPATSENGLANAASFFKQLRPLEGRAKGVVPASRTTHSGARFDSPLARTAAVKARGL